KLNFWSSYSGNSNSPMGGKFLMGILYVWRLLCEVTTVSSLPAAAPAAVILRIVVATPLTSSSVSVNQARLRCCNSIGVYPVNSEKIARSDFRELTGEIPIELQTRKRAWFTDTLG